MAYQSYIKHGGAGQSLERLAERGGFGRDELIDFLDEFTRDAEKSCTMPAFPLAPPPKP